MITFEVEEEKYVCLHIESRFPLFGKKYQLKFANDIPPETHCLVHFPSLIRLISIFTSIALNYSYKLPQAKCHGAHALINPWPGLCLCMLNFKSCI